MVEKRPVGRPKKSYETIGKYFKIRIDLAKKLETHDNQTDVIEQALETFFNIEKESNQYLIKTKMKLIQELNSINSILSVRTRKEEEKKQIEQIENAKLKKEYKNFTNRVKNDIELSEQGLTVNVSGYRESFSIQLTKEDLQDIASDIRNDKFTFEKFKKFKFEKI